MKKIINEPGKFVDEMIQGILLAHPGQLKTVGDDLRVLARADAPLSGKVGIVTGGGSGHLPLFKGYVGTGLCSAVAIGNVFSSPSSLAPMIGASGAVSGLMAAASWFMGEKFVNADDQHETPVDFAQPEAGAPEPQRMR